ncbi:MAG: type I-C CRISPR-associated protein Cas7/Csd2 [Anaerovoracaceae bacterium]
MTVLQNKVDFVAIISCKNANPNGDPLNGNQPRKNFKGLGEISDVCIKRKIRNRLMDMGENVFVQSDDKKTDEFSSLRERADANAELKAAEKAKDKDGYSKVANESWIDVRSFGQVFAFKGEKGSGDGLSVGIRGPVSIQPAFSIDIVDVSSTQITKSVNSESTDSGKKSSDTMGMKHRVDFGIYLLKGSINVQLAEKTGFSEEDAEKIKEALRTLFFNDCSSARPEGSMEIEKLYWWKHNNKLGQYSAAKVHRSLKITRKEDSDTESIDDYEIKVEDIPGLEYTAYDGL